MAEVKTAEEIRKMRASSKINDQVMERVCAMLREGVTEVEIYHCLERLYEEYGAKMAFAGVSFGENTAEVHHIFPQEKKLQKGDAVLLDIGGVYDGYCSDMTRTVFFGGITPEQEKIYRIVQKAQETASCAVKPGMPCSEIDLAARQVIEEAGYGPYFLHSTGHGIGKEVHEGLRISKDSTDTVREGDIFSIEPGIYLEGELGVRIEDLVVVTKDGCESLNHVTKDIWIL